jgi:low temperature requirement protein LtrA
MIGRAARTSQLRVRSGHDHARVTYVELFFDLVFVFAVTQLSHGLLGDLTLLGVLRTGLLMMAVWWVWIYTSWITNWLDPEKPAVRLMLFALMLAGLVLSSSIPLAFANRGLAFAMAYVFMQVGRSLFMLWALKRHDEGNYRNFLRITTWLVLAAFFWIGGACAHDAARLALWAAAVGIEYLMPAAGMWVPGLGRSTTADWTVDGGHLAERCALFIIIALGESILITGATFAEQAWTSTSVAAFVVTFLGSVAMWAIYFNIGAERASRQIAASDDPGRLARSGYTYVHLLLVAGVVVAAVADEMVLAHPGGVTDIRTMAVIIAGPALYVVGNALFKRLSAPHTPLSHLVGLGLLVLLAPAAFLVPPLALSAGSTAILILVAVWEWASLKRKAA